jgi:hypothetical protein
MRVRQVVFPIIRRLVMTPPTTGTRPDSPPYSQHTEKPQRGISGFADCTAAHPLRRELLAGECTGAILPENTANSIAECIHFWKEAAQAHLEAEHRYATASEAVEAEQEHLPTIGPMPEAPDLVGFAADATRAALAACDAEREQILRKVRDLCDRAEREAGRNPDYRKARDSYDRNLEEWYATDARQRAKERAIADTHGLEEAKRADREARRRMQEAGQRLLNAPIRSQLDAVTVLCVLLYTADFTYDIFDDEVKCLGVDPDGLPQRLAPWLPVSPAARPLG